MIKINLPYHDDEVYAICYSKDKRLYHNSNFDDSNKAKIIVLVCEWLDGDDSDNQPKRLTRSIKEKKPQRAPPLGFRCFVHRLDTISFLADAIITYAPS